VALTLKNSYTKSREVFEPLDPAGKDVTIYSCGPTVYSFAHIGNFRSFLFADVLRRVLERRGYRVRQVMNITDVGHLTEDHLADASGEDKLSKAARELGTDPFTIAQHFERLFVEDAKSLRLRNYSPPYADDASLHPRATAHIPEMLAMIQALIERGFAYVDGSGQVYFEVARFPEYGKLSGKVLDELEAGARVAVRDEKKDPRDFALWKVDDKHLMRWDPHGPSGWRDGEYERYRALVPKGVDARIRPGFPGWHIECSAMSAAHLGDRIDIHTGGEDNVFPHHECEIAQSFGATGITTKAPSSAEDAGSDRPIFARYWIHGRHLLVDDRKMSKRDGTFYTLRDLLDPAANGRADLAARLEAQGFAGGRVPASVLRYALISNPYTQPMNFSLDLLVQAKSSVERLQSRWDRLGEIGSETDAAPSESIAKLLREKEAAFDVALDDNLNLPNALAAVFELVTALNQLDATLTPGDAHAARRTLQAFDSVLDVLDRVPRSGMITTARLEELIGSPQLDDHADEVERLVAQRQRARRAKDFKAADAVRDALRAKGIVIEDTPAGIRWKRS